MTSARTSKKPKRVGFQGELGAFSQQAIRQLLGLKAQPIPHQRFDQVFAALKARKVDAAVLPLENTLAGSVHDNYNLLLQYPFEITAETNVRVVHNLIAPPGVGFRSIKTVYSHPVALNQCLDFFARYPRLFYLDLIGHRDDKVVRNALSHLDELADFLRVLGSYRAA